MKALTVVVPVYNVENYLRRCIDSILAQTYPPKQIILVDDGSTDGSGKICDDYAQRERSICVIHQQNQGQAEARNQGIRMATTELIAFVDSDDYLDPEMYAVLLQNMIDSSADMSVCGRWVEKENGDKYPHRVVGMRKTWDTKHALIELNSYQYFDMSFCGVLFRRELFEKPSPLRFPIGKTCEDYYLMHQVIARTEKVVYDSNPYYHYVQRYNSTSRNCTINLAPMDASMAQLAFYQEHYPELTYVAETACAFSYMGIYSAYIRDGQACPKALLKKLKQISKGYLPSVLRNPHIPKIKKLQALSFCFALPVYRFVIGQTEHR